MAPLRKEVMDFYLSLELRLLYLLPYEHGQLCYTFIETIEAYSVTSNDYRTLDLVALLVSEYRCAWSRY